MPKPHGPAAELSPCLLFYLATGRTDDPAVPVEVVDTVEYGHHAAFSLAGRVARYLGYPGTWPSHRAAIDEVAELYQAHADEIDAAARAATNGRYVSYAQAILARAAEIERESKQEEV